MRIFKRKIVRSIAFALVLVMVFMGLSQMILLIQKRHDGMIINRSKTLWYLQEESNDSIDVLLVGDSLSYSAFSTYDMWEKGGIASFVAGQPGQKISETYNMVDTAFQKQKPKVVVLETNVLFRTDGGTSGMKDKFSQIAMNVFPVFRFHDMWKQLLFGAKQERDNFKGFGLRTTVNPYRGGDYMSSKKLGSKIPNYTKETLQKIQKMCEENGAELVLISTPSPQNYNNKRHEEILKLAEENNLKYEDMNLMTEQLGIDWNSDSLDKGDHLNLLGAEKVTRFLLEYLLAHYALSDHRGEEAYEEWRNQALAFQMAMQKKRSAMLSQAGGSL